ncbi:MAG: CehA/McbA family metallohydrolase [Pirellulales bacterium]
MKLLHTCPAKLVVVLLLVTTSPAVWGAELVRLSAENWEQYAPQGKEVDAIYGDFVLRNDKLIAVIAQPLASRHANLTVKNVAGAIIDLTRRDRPNDQLSAYYPCGSRYSFIDDATVDGRKADRDNAASFAGKTVSLELIAVLDAKSKVPRPRVTLRYTLADGEPFLRVDTVHRNDSDKPLAETFTDAIRADRVFRFGTDDRLFESSPVAKAAHNLFWASDEWFGQSYGVICEGRQIRMTETNRPQLQLLKNGSAEAAIPPGAEITIARKIFPGATIYDVRAVAQELAGVASRPLNVQVTDRDGPVAHALVAIDDGRAPEPPPDADKAIPETTATQPAPQPIETTYLKASYGLARTDAEGRIRAHLPHGKWRVVVRALGRGEASFPANSLPDGAGKKNPRGGKVSPEINTAIKLPAPGYVVARITDDRDRPIPAKVAFIGKNGTADPFFGPDTSDVAIHNVRYTHNGVFRQQIAPGRYDVIVSYGTEYDVLFTEIEVTRGEEIPLAARLARSVNTAGWVSSDFHSHSSPSGDNVTSQEGRVINLLAEHIEFAPCTEHNRVDSYVPILKRLDAEGLMATCSGIELTGQPLPVNHQNAFPLVHKTRTQDGGGPETHLDPVVQIERLALWDDKSDKIVQGNHPNLPQILGDRDLNAQPDDGFRKMFGFMDVVEVHPPQGIFTPPAQLDTTGKGPRNPIFHWMQMTNLGYRIPGVVNTDAHYNFHGSGGLRNYIKSSTDDPAKIDTMEMVRESEAGHIVMTNGPFLEVSARAASVAAAATAKQGRDRTPADGKAALPGDDLAAPDGQVELSIRVQCPNWFDINRVQVFLNGRPEKNVNFTRRENPDRFGKDAVRFNATIPLKLTEDTHIIVAAIGEGLTLGTIMGPSWGKQPPTAVSNPIFVDVDGGGFKPNGDRLGVELPLEKSFRHEHTH